MKKIFASLAAGAQLFAAGCSSVNVSSILPFGEGRTVERSRVPADSVTYQCAGGKRFYLRYLDNGAAAWVILPEREFRLDKVSGDSGMRFGNGKAELRISGEEATLSDGPTATYTACKIPAAEPAKQ